MKVATSSVAKRLFCLRSTLFFNIISIIVCIITHIASDVFF